MGIYGFLFEVLSSFIDYEFMEVIMKNYCEDLIKKVCNLEPIAWKNKKLISSREALKQISLKKDEIIDAEERLIRFAPLIRILFPETKDGIIESPLIEIPKMKEKLEDRFHKKINGNLFLKCDNELKIAGSVKARGGIYEVLKHAEQLAVENGMLDKSCDYSVLSEERFKKFFSNYKIAVGSTGNLGLSIGIMSAALGFNVDVHMSRDAKKWKKDLLRSKGVNVIEYDDDYSKAVEEGRRQCSLNPMSYFIDDENSVDLFLGYSTAALRLKNQLEAKNIFISEKQRLNVYLPCGVGGAPGGITFGLKHVFGDDVSCFFVEPTHSPCMLLGLLSGKNENIHVRDYGIDNITEADGLAVGSPSKLACSIADKLLEGEYTIEDDELFKLLALLKDTESVKIEPSAASSLIGCFMFDSCDSDIHISWATGGLLLPEEMYLSMYEKGRSLLD